MEVAKAAGSDPETVPDIHFAGVLHEIGQIRLPNELLRKPVVTLAGRERTPGPSTRYMGMRALMSLDSLHNASAKCHAGSRPLP